MKKFLSLLFYVYTLLIVACKESGNETNIPSLPIIGIAVGDVDVSTLSFSVISTNAELVKYMVLEGDLGSPTTAQILEEGVIVAPNKIAIITLYDLKPETTYKLWAAAQNSQGTSLSNKLEIRTLSRTEETSKGIISFADPLVKTTCIARWDMDNDKELSLEEAALVSSIGGVFAYQAITTFDELQYFVGLSSIDSNSFLECGNLTQITIPESISVIKSKAFQGCNNLIQINLERIISIEDYAFSGCSSLCSLILPEIKTIGKSAFSKSMSMENLSLGSLVTSIGDRAFYGCKNLKTVYCESVRPPILGSEVFYGNTELSIGTLSGPLDCIFYVPEESIRDYTNDYQRGWGPYSSKIRGFQFDE